MNGGIAGIIGKYVNFNLLQELLVKYVNFNLLQELLVKYANFNLLQELLVNMLILTYCRNYW